MEWFEQNLKYFSTGQRSKLLSIVTEERFSKVEESLQNDIIYLFLQIDADTSEQTLRNVADCLIRTVLFTEDVWIFRVSEGEGFTIGITFPETGNSTVFSDGILVAREDTKGTIISTTIDNSMFPTGEETIDGELVTILSGMINVSDLSLGGDMFYKIRAQVESRNTDGTPTGEASVKIGSFYLIVGSNIDEQ